MYSHTQNENGTYNTRCLDCFLTIASCIESEQDLELIEVRHICPEKAIHQLLECDCGHHHPHAHAAVN